jgi:HEAT repeat protein
MKVLSVGSTAGILACALTLAAGVFAAEKAPSFEGAQWIWDREAQQKSGTWYFRRGFDFPAGEKPKTAKILITCDNLWTLYVNGKRLESSEKSNSAWQTGMIVDASKELVIEQNAIAVEGVNTLPGAAGLLVKLLVTFESGKTFELVSDETWLSAAKPEKGWTDNGFMGGESWKPSQIIAPFGAAPWGKPKLSATKKATPKDKEYPRESDFTGSAFASGAVFVGDALNFNVSGQPTYVQFIKGTRAYFEMDPMTPAAIGSRLYSLVPLRPDGKLTLLCDAAGGKLGSPSVSYDGKTVFFSMAREGDAWFHIYAVAPDGGNLRQITHGPFHDYDPVELPDGRIVFSSTRIGNREEYHAKYASCLFTCDAGGSDIRPLTTHIVADREPRVTADGSLVFLRADNFLERAKVEVHVHQTRLDGSAGQVIIGPDRKGVQHDRDAAAEHPMDWLRRFGAGSPAPLPDGRVLAITQKGLVSSEDPSGRPLDPEFLPYDMSALPDGRLLCTSLHRSAILIYHPGTKETRQVAAAHEIGVRDLHSVMPLGARTKPSAPPSIIEAERWADASPTGYLYCQNALNTQHVSADVSRIRAIRVYEARPFTLEPTKTIYSHIGTVANELGTVPLAADGSFYIEVPADRPLALQAIDGEGRAVISELTWIYARPGEQRSCVGCHAPSAATPRMTVSDALKNRPMRFVGQGTPHQFRANNGANGGIVNLQLDRFREAAAVNLPENWRSLIAACDETDPGSRLSTVQRLSLFRARESVPYLVKALSDADDTVRCAAALALSACGDRSAVAPLINALSDRNPTVVLAVRNALEHLTGHPEGSTEWAAIESAMIERLQSADMAAVHTALESLGHVGGDAARAAIRAYLTANPEGELRVLMAAMRSIGHLKDSAAVPLLTGILNDNLTKKGKGGHHEFGFGQKPIYLSATAAEALGHIGGEQAEAALLEAFPRLNSFEDYVFRVAEHKWLMGMNCSVLHHRMLEAFDRMNSTATGALTEKIIESVPADKDRGLLYELDSYERLSARVIKQGGRLADVIESCLHIIGDTSAKADAALVAAISKAPHSEGHIRRLSAPSRAAQILSVVCDDLSYAPRIRALLLGIRAGEADENQAWCSFMLIRLLGRLGDRESIPLLIGMIEKDPPEAKLGLNPPPAHTIYGGWRPFHRPCAAWALGRLQAREAIPALLSALENLENISSTREQAAIALGEMSGEGLLEPIDRIAQGYPEEMTRRALLRSRMKLARSGTGAAHATLAQ